MRARGGKRARARTRVVECRRPAIRRQRDECRIDKERAFGRPAERAAAPLARLRSRRHAYMSNKKSQPSAAGKRRRGPPGRVVAAATFVDSRQHTSARVSTTRVKAAFYGRQNSNETPNETRARALERQDFWSCRSIKRIYANSSKQPRRRRLILFCLYPKL